jgi:hypothetical protein
MDTLLSRKTLFIIILILLLCNILWLFAFASRGRELGQAQNSLAQVQENKNILAFQKLFVDKVLKADGVVDYDTRRLLDQSVGSTNNKPVIDAWNAFIAAKTEADAQNKVKNLLSVMADQMYGK